MCVPPRFFSSIIEQKVRPFAASLRSAQGLGMETRTLAPRSTPATQQQRTQSALSSRASQTRPRPARHAQGGAQDRLLSPPSTPLREGRPCRGGGAPDNLFRECISIVRMR